MLQLTHAEWVRRACSLASTEMLQWLSLGGPAMLVLGLMSITAMTLIISKLWEFSEGRISDTAFVEPALQAYEQGQGDRARQIAQASPSPLARVWILAVNWLDDPALDAAKARERIERAAAEQIEQSRSRIRTLDLIGTLAPLVGLLGTVLGMIDAFQALQAAGNRVEPAILSGGIWKALITTAAGLIVAIPVVTSAHYLDRRVAGLQAAMESALTQLLTRPRSIDR